GARRSGRESLAAQPFAGLRRSTVGQRIVGGPALRRAPALDGRAENRWRPSPSQGSGARRSGRESLAAQPFAGLRRSTVGQRIVGGPALRRAPALDGRAENRWRPSPSQGSGARRSGRESLAAQPFAGRRRSTVGQRIAGGAALRRAPALDGRAENRRRRSPSQAAGARRSGRESLAPQPFAGRRRSTVRQRLVGGAALRRAPALDGRAENRWRRSASQGAGARRSGRESSEAQPFAGRRRSTVGQRIVGAAALRRTPALDGPAETRWRRSPSPGAGARRPGRASLEAQPFAGRRRSTVGQRIVGGAALRRAPALDGRAENRWRRSPSQGAGARRSG